MYGLAGEAGIACLKAHFKPDGLSGSELKATSYIKGNAANCEIHVTSFKKSAKRLSLK